MLLTLFVFMNLGIFGCKQSIPEQEETPAPETEILNNLFEDSIRLLPADKLEKIGTKNNLPTQWIYQNAFSATAVQPQRFNQYQMAKQVLPLLASFRLGIPFQNEFEDFDLMLLSTRFAFVKLVDSQSGKQLTDKYPLPARAIYLSKSTPINQQELIDLTFAGAKKEDIAEKTFGNFKTTSLKQSIMLPLDESYQQVAKADNILSAIYFPTEKSAVIVTGSEEDVEKYFSMQDGDSKGILAQTIGRLNPNEFDFAFLSHYNNPMKELILMDPNSAVPPQLRETFMKNVASFSFLINATATESSDMLNLTIEANDNATASEIQTQLGGILMQMVEDIPKGNVIEEGTPLPAYLDSLENILKSIQMNVSENLLIVSLKQSTEVNQYFQTVVLELEKYMNESKRKTQLDAIENQLFYLAQAISRYYSKFNAYPPLTINAPDGTPLLSWRVALLQMFGTEGEALYKEFKLDQPWNSDHNIKLLEKIPNIYVSPIDPSLQTKTTFQIFSSPETPFGAHPNDLKIQNILNPASTLMIVSVAPNNAIEWTKPESLSFDESALTNLFGDVVLGLPFMGDVFRSAFNGEPDQILKLKNKIIDQAMEPTPTSTQETTPTTNDVPATQDNVNPTNAPPTLENASAVDNIPDVEINPAE